MAGFCLLDSFKQQLSGRRPEEAKLLFLCLPIGRRFRLLSGCVETVALSRAAKGGQLPGGCILSLSVDGVSCVSKDRARDRKMEATLPDPTYSNP